MIMIVNEGQPLTYILASIVMLGALVLAWRGYHHAAREDFHRRRAIRERDGR
jgi:hypothetical protein